MISVSRHFRCYVKVVEAKTAHESSEAGVKEMPSVSGGGVCPGVYPLSIPKIHGYFFFSLSLQRILCLLPNVAFHVWCVRVCLSVSAQ